MALLAAIGVGAKVVKGLWKAGRAKRKARRAARKSKKQAAKIKELQAESSAIFSKLGLAGLPNVNNATVDKVQDKVFPSEDFTSDNFDFQGAKTEFASAQNRLRRKMPVWVWWVVGVVSFLATVVTIILSLRKRR